MSGPIEVHGTRVLLRELSLDDLSVISEYTSDPDVCRYVSWGPISADETTRWVSAAIAAADVSPRVWYELAVVIAASGEVAGHVGLELERTQRLTGEFGYVLRSNFWGQGIATEAASLLLRFAFGDLGLHRVWASCDEENRASVRVLEKLGLALEGRHRDNLFVRGRWRTSLIYAALRED